MHAIMCFYYLMTLAGEAVGGEQREIGERYSSNHRRDPTDGRYGFRPTQTCSPSWPADTMSAGTDSDNKPKISRGWPGREDPSIPSSCLPPSPVGVSSTHDQGHVACRRALRKERDVLFPLPRWCCHY